MENSVRVIRERCTVYGLVYGMRKSYKYMFFLYNRSNSDEVYGVHGALLQFFTKEKIKISGEGERINTKNIPCKPYTPYTFINPVSVIL
jgi:hypothetical protein